MRQLGMLAAIGITIVVKQLFPMLGMPAALSQGTPVLVMTRLPEAFAALVPGCASAASGTRRSWTGASFRGCKGGH